MVANPSGQIVNTHHHGLKVREYWSMLFRMNEQAWREKRWADILDDEQLTAAMHSAFPDREESRVFKRVRHVRAEFNRGGWTGGARPHFQSHRYKRVSGSVARCTPRGKPTQLATEIDKLKVESKKDEQSQTGSVTMETDGAA